MINERKDDTPMQQLFTNYSVGEIIIFIIVLAVAIKELITLIEWFKDRARKKIKIEDKPLLLLEVIKQHSRLLCAIKGELKLLKQDILLLISSDKDDIKFSITKLHHYFVYQLGFIDDYSLDSLLKRYLHYKEEGGNSYVEILMNELRALPKKGPMKNKL